MFSFLISWESGKELSLYTLCLIYKILFNGNDPRHINFIWIKRNINGFKKSISFKKLGSNSSFKISFFQASEESILNKLGFDVSCNLKRW